MASTIFNFADFTSFAGETELNDTTYATIARGIIDYVENQYKIHFSDTIITLPIWLESGQTTIDAPVYPMNNIVKVEYDGVELTSDEYSWYGRDILLVTALTDIRKPITFTLDVGFETSIPGDIKLAVYRHIMSVYFSIKKHTDNLEKAVNSQGNTSYYAQDVMPIASKQTYEYYTARRLIDF